MLLVIGSVGVILFWKDDTSPVDQGDEENSQSDLGAIEFNGKKYHYNNELFNILFVGIDNNEELKEYDIPDDAGHADSIMVLTLNKVTKEGRILQIPRDSLTEIDVYDTNGNRQESVEKQIMFQYPFANGGENGCWAMKKTVSELLYDLPIDGYFALDIAGLPIINDAVGGVTITIPEDYTEIDLLFKKGATVTLNGEQAHAYVRYRDTLKHFTNQGRMERQLQYLPALISAIKSNLNPEDGYYDVLYPLVSKYVSTDMREDQMRDFYEFNLVEAEMDFVPGEWAVGEDRDEYHVDSEQLQKQLIEIFYVLEK